MRLARVSWYRYFLVIFDIRERRNTVAIFLPTLRTVLVFRGPFGRLPGARYPACAAATAKIYSPQHVRKTYERVVRCDRIKVDSTHTYASAYVRVFVHVGIFVYLNRCQKIPDLTNPFLSFAKQFWSPPLLRNSLSLSLSILHVVNDPSLRPLSACIRQSFVRFTQIAIVGFRWRSLSFFSRVSWKRDWLPWDFRFGAKATPLTLRFSVRSE